MAELTMSRGPAVWERPNPAELAPQETPDDPGTLGAQVQTAEEEPQAKPSKA